MAHYQHQMHTHDKHNCISGLICKCKFH